LLRGWYLRDRLLRYMLLRCWDLCDRLLRYRLLRGWYLRDRLLRYMLLRCWYLWDSFLRYMCVVAGWVYWKCTQGRLTLCGIWLKKLCLAICRQRQGRTKMSCYTCVAGSGVMSAIMATCCRRQLPHWWIAEPTKSVKKIMRIHVWCTWCLPGFVKNQ
jgi:hypothetical protein